MRLLIGLLLSIIIGGIAYWRGSLTRSGWLGAVITGTLTFGLGGLTWGMTLVAFFVSSSLLSHFKQAQKERLAAEKFEKGGQRDIWQALANGGIGTLLACLYAALGEPVLLLGAFAGVMATVTADTWATELGVLSTHAPRSITTMRPVAPGTSGGVTLLGLLASALGALLIGLILLFGMGLEHGLWLPRLIPAVLLGGLLGSLLDSWLGATLQAIYRGPHGETERRYTTKGQPNSIQRGLPWMNNDLVNMLSSVAGALGAMLFFL